MKTQVRPMVKADRKTVSKLLENTAEFTREEVKVALQLVDSYLNVGSASGYYVAVAQQDVEVIGYICYGPTPLTENTWDVYWITVDAEKKGTGIGRALLEYAEKKIFGKQGRIIVIETSSKPSYENTRKFYDKMQYSIQTVIQDYYAPGDGKVIFLKKNTEDR